MRGKRGMLQRQTGIMPEGLVEDPEEIDAHLEYIVPDKTNAVTVAVSSSAFAISSTSLSSSMSGLDRTISSCQLSSKKHLQVPAVVVAPHDKGSSSSLSSFSPSILQKQLTQTTKPLLVVPTSGSPGQITKQRSQPEMIRTYSGGPPTIKKQPSQPSVLSHTTTSTLLQEYSSPSTTGTSGSQQSMTFIPMQLIKKQKSAPGSSSPNLSPHLRPIQPKPSSLLDKDLPQIQLTVSDEDGSYTTRLPRAISEEPMISRSQGVDLLSPGPLPLTQSVSQDTGLDGGAALINRLVTSAHASQNLSIPKLSTSSSSVAHSPVLREGPALGCNYCWNSQDNQGRVQRRKTKYHCPACRTNLCIVPCFHEYHSQMQMQQDQHKQFTKVLTKTSST